MAFNSQLLNCIKVNNLIESPSDHLLSFLQIFFLKEKFLALDDSELEDEWV